MGADLALGVHLVPLGSLVDLVLGAHEGRGVDEGQEAGRAGGAGVLVDLGLDVHAHDESDQLRVDGDAGHGQVPHEASELVLVEVALGIGVELLVGHAGDDDLDSVHVVAEVHDRDAERAELEAVGQPDVGLRADDFLRTDLREQDELDDHHCGGGRRDEVLVQVEDAAVGHLAVVHVQVAEDLERLPERAEPRVGVHRVLVELDVRGAVLQELALSLALAGAAVVQVLVRDRREQLIRLRVDLHPRGVGDEVGYEALDESAGGERTVDVVGELTNHGASLQRLGTGWYFRFA